MANWNLSVQLCCVCSGASSVTAVSNCSPCAPVAYCICSCSVLNVLVSLLQLGNTRLVPLPGACASCRGCRTPLNTSTCLPVVVQHRLQPTPTSGCWCFVCVQALTAAHLPHAMGGTAHIGMLVVARHANHHDSSFIDCKLSRQVLPWCYQALHDVPGLLLQLIWTFGTCWCYRLFLYQSQL